MLPVLGHIRLARDGQVSLGQLLLDELPSADGHLAVDGGDAAVMQPDVGQLLQLLRLFQNLGQPLRLRLLSGERNEVADGGRGAELGVGDEVAGELV